MHVQNLFPVLHFERIIISSFWNLFPVTRLPSSLSITTPLPCSPPQIRLIDHYLFPSKRWVFQNESKNDSNSKLLLKSIARKCVSLPLKALFPGNWGLNYMQTPHHIQVFPWDHLGCQGSGANLDSWVRPSCSPWPLNFGWPQSQSLGLS